MDEEYDKIDNLNHYRDHYHRYGCITQCFDRKLMVIFSKQIGWFEQFFHIAF